MFIFILIFVDALRGPQLWCHMFIFFSVSSQVARGSAFGPAPWCTHTHTLPSQLPPYHTPHPSTCLSANADCPRRTQGHTHPHPHTPNPNPASPPYNTDRPKWAWARWIPGPFTRASTRVNQGASPAYLAPDSLPSWGGGRKLIQTHPVALLLSHLSHLRVSLLLFVFFSLSSNSGAFFMPPRP